MVYNPGRDLVIRTTIACGVIETVAVALRLVARWRSKAAVAKDDWVLISSLIPSYAMLANGLVMVTLGGAGRRASTLSPSEITVFMKTMSTSLITYSLSITLVKVSILLLYRRIFDTRRFKIITSVLGAICVIWGIVAVFCTIFQCRPISGMWRPEYSFTNHCIDIKAYYAGISGASMGLDIIILVLPLYMIWGLGLPLGQKVALTGIFLLGGLGCVASLFRIITVHFIKSTDLPYTCIIPYIWSQIEPTTAIICACLTTYRPLFKGLRLPSITALTWISGSGTRSSTGDPDRGTVASAATFHLPERPSSGQWSKFDFCTDDKRQSEVSSAQELRHFQETSSKATNGGLRMYDMGGQIEEGKGPASEKGSWLDSPQSGSQPGSRRGSYLF